MGSLARRHVQIVRNDDGKVVDLQIALLRPMSNSDSMLLCWVEPTQVEERNSFGRKGRFGVDLNRCIGVYNDTCCAGGATNGCVHVDIGPCDQYVSKDARYSMW